MALRSTPQRWLVAKTTGKVTGDSSNAGFFIRLPPDISKQFPDLSTKDQGGEVSPETRLKISAARKSTPLSALQHKHLGHISSANRGKPKSAEHRAKIAAALRGKTKSATHVGHQRQSRWGV